MFKTLPVDCSKLLFSRLDKAARKTKFVIQKSLKFSTAGSLFALINAILTGRASFNQLAMGLKHREPFSLTKQAVWKRTNALALDLIVELGESGYKARLIAIRATKEVAKRTLRAANGDARIKGETLSKSKLLRCQWHLVATNIPREKMPARVVGERDRCRWKIEIVFRAWKQSGNLDKALNRTSNEDHFQVLMLAAMIDQVLSLRVMAFVRNLAPGERMSLERLFDDWSAMILKCQEMSEIWNYQPDIRHLAVDIHKDRTPFEDTWIKPLKLTPMAVSPENYSRRSSPSFMTCFASENSGSIFKAVSNASEAAFLSPRASNERAS